jgi:hypothetical protein
MFKLIHKDSYHKLLQECETLKEQNYQLQQEADKVLMICKTFDNIPQLDDVIEKIKDMTPLVRE